MKIKDKGVVVYGLMFLAWITLIILSILSAVFYPFRSVLTWLKK